MPVSKRRHTLGVSFLVFLDSPPCMQPPEFSTYSLLRKWRFEGGQQVRLGDGLNLTYVCPTKNYLHNTQMFLLSKVAHSQL